MNKEFERIYNSQACLFGKVLNQMKGVILFYDVTDDTVVVKQPLDGEALVFEHVEREVLGTKVHPLDQEKTRKLFQSLKNGEEPDVLRVRWHNTLGDEFDYYKVKFQFVQDESIKDRTIAVGCAFNITEEFGLQKKLELTQMQLLEEEDMLERTLMRYVYNRNFYMVVAIDGKTGCAKELIEPADDGASRFIDIDNIDENSERFFRKYLLPDDVEEMVAKTRLHKVIEKLDEEGQYVFFYKGRSIHGVFHYFRCEFSYIDKESKLIFFASTDITTDVVHNKELEEAMRLSYERECDAIKAKDNFLANMSHEIRTPLNAIVGMAEIIKMDIRNPKKVKECMDILVSASQNLGRVVSDVLDASSLQTGGIRLKPSSRNLESLLEQVKMDFVSTYKKKKQKFEIITEIQHKQVMIDAERAKRVVLNILGNAAKFSPENGTIQMKLTELPGEHDLECILKLEISDNGKGINKEDLEHVFEPFYRDKESASNYLGGTGLGLSVVKNIVDQKGATISISSEPNKGTIITIMDPVTYVEEKPHGVANKESVLKGKRVLLVEDQPINMLVARKMLERFGAKVDTAEHGRYAVEQYRKKEAGTYDMIFMDIQMPIMDGYEATRQIRNSEKEDAKSIKIISMTANVLSEDIDKSREAGMDAHIGKPIRSEELQQLIISVLD